MTPHTYHVIHPELTEAVDAAMDDDRALFAAHPAEVVRIRPALDGEFLVDAEAGYYGERTPIAVQGFPLGVYPHVAVVDGLAAAGIDRAADGSGMRVRYPLSNHLPEHVDDIKRFAWVETVVALHSIRAQNKAKKVKARRHPPRRGGRGFG